MNDQIGMEKLSKRPVRFRGLNEAINRVEIFSALFGNFISEMLSGSEVDNVKSIGPDDPDTFCSVYHGAPQRIHAICEDLERKLEEIKEIIF